MSVSHFLYNASISENGVEHDYFRIETGQSYRKEEKKMKGENTEVDHFTS